MSKIDKFELGIIYNKDRQIVNHRSALKVFLNPFLRILGFHIATKVDLKTQVLLNPILVSCRKKRNITFMYNSDEEYTIEKRRILL